MSNFASRNLILGGVAALAWVAFAAAWSLSIVLDRTRPWEGAPQLWFFVGWVALMVGAGVTTAAAFLSMPRGRRRALITAGRTVAVLGMLIVIALPWATPAWMLALGVGLVLAGFGLRDRALLAIGASFGVAFAAFAGLTMLEVGRPDQHGDHPVAWVTAMFIAALGAATGIAAWSRSDRSPAPTQAVPS